MNDTHEVISAFLDDEPFEPRELVAALSDPAGRELLIDLMALRHLAQTNGSASAIAHKPRRPVIGALLAAAAVLVALVGGYMAGQRRTDDAFSTVPAATRVVETSTAWQPVPAGRM
jgi:hypothetical protein